MPSITSFGRRFEHQLVRHVDACSVFSLVVLCVILAAHRSNAISQCRSRPRPGREEPITPTGRGGEGDAQFKYSLHVRYAACAKRFTLAGWHQSLQPDRKRTAHIRASLKPLVSAGQWRSSAHAILGETILYFLVQPLTTVFLNLSEFQQQLAIGLGKNFQRAA
jgi:hypothetical protein